MYDLVGIDGNAYNVMSYTARALKETGHGDMVAQMYEEAKSGDYNNLLCVCMKYVDIANDTLMADDDYDDWDEEEDW